MKEGITPGVLVFDNKVVVVSEDGHLIEFLRQEKEEGVCGD